MITSGGVILRLGFGLIRSSIVFVIKSVIAFSSLPSSLSFSTFEIAFTINSDVSAEYRKLIFLQKQGHPQPLRGLEEISLYLNCLASLCLWGSATAHGIRGLQPWHYSVKADLFANFTKRIGHT